MSSQVEIAPAALEGIDGARIVYSGPRPSGLEGQQAIVRFANGLGLSIIDGPGTYGVEAAVIRFDGDGSHDFECTDQRVHGWLNAERLAEVATETARHE